MSYKSIDGLMRHLRDNGIVISGTPQKRQLINTGYYHGYKGYRFFGDSQRKIPFGSYKEIYATIQYDSKLKALFYDKVMYIEMAVKNIALDVIISEIKSENIQDMYDKAISSYNNSSPALPIDTRKKIQQNKLNLQNTIQTYLSNAYKQGNPKITHFYNNMSYSGVPLWALFEIMTLGDVGFLLSCLIPNIRKAISQRIGINISSDTNLELVYKYIYALKDLRNAIAHNAVVFDTRFRKIDPTNSMKKCLQLEVKLPYMNFKSIGDYVILICYYLKLLKVSKTEIKAFIRDFEKIVSEYKTAVSVPIASMVIHPDLNARMKILKNFI